MNRLDAHIFFPAQDILSARTTKASGYFFTKDTEKTWHRPFLFAFEYAIIKNE